MRPVSDHGGKILAAFVWLISAVITIALAVTWGPEAREDVGTVLAGLAIVSVVVTYFGLINDAGRGE